MNELFIALVVTPALFAALIIMVSIGDKVKWYFRKKEFERNAKMRFGNE